MSANFFMRIDTYKTEYMEMLIPVLEEYYDYPEDDEISEALENAGESFEYQIEDDGEYEHEVGEAYELANYLLERCPESEFSFESGYSYDDINWGYSERGLYNKGKFAYTSLEYDYESMDDEGYYPTKKYSKEIRTYGSITNMHACSSTEEKYSDDEDSGNRRLAKIYIFEEIGSHGPDDSDKIIKNAKVGDKAGVSYINDLGVLELSMGKTETKIKTSSISFDRLSNINGDEDDLESPDYIYFDDGEIVEKTKSPDGDTIIKVKITGTAFFDGDTTYTPDEPGYAAYKDILEVCRSHNYEL